LVYNSVQILAMIGINDNPFVAKLGIVKPHYRAYPLLTSSGSSTDPYQSNMHF